MIQGAGLTAAVESLISRPLRDMWYRVFRSAHADDPLGKGRQIVAQRYNCANSARVLYLGDTFNTCAEEVQAFGFPFQHSSITFVKVQFDLKAVIDLRRPEVLKALGTSESELQLNFRAARMLPTPSQSLGEYCAASLAADGLLYKSAAGGGTCLAVIEASLGSFGSCLQAPDSKGNLVSLP